MIERLLYMIVISAAVLTLLSLAWKILTDRKLARHQEEWNDIKQKCVAEGMDFMKVEDEYMRYIDDLYKTERNSFLGCCFPRF